MTQGRKLLLTFVIGAALGVVGTLLAPRFLGPYVPESVRGAEKVVQGVVTAKGRPKDRLLLTLNTSEGAVLATFTKRVDEIALLVDTGDTVSLALARYQPFVTDPEIKTVRKGSSGTPPETVPPTTRQGPLQPESVPPDTAGTPGERGRDTTT